MLKKRDIIILGITLLGLVISGCTDRGTPGDDNLSGDTSGAALSEADAALMNEMIGVTDPEILQLETEVAEFEALIGEMSTGEDISVEEI